VVRNERLIKAEQKIYKGEKMNKILEKSKGAVSVFLALIMLPMFTFAGLVIDGARIQSAKSAAQGAGELTLNAGLSEYDQTLLSVYGLFALSSTPEDLQVNLSMYFSNTLEGKTTTISSGSTSKTAVEDWTKSIVDACMGGQSGIGELNVSNMLQMDSVESEFDVIGAENSTLIHPEVLDKQIVEYMKYRGPVSLATGFMEKINLLSALPQQTEAVTAKVEYDKKMSSVQDACDAAYEAMLLYKKDVETTVSSSDTVDGTGLFSGIYANSEGFNANLNYAFLKAIGRYQISAQYYIFLNTEAFTDDSINASVTINIPGKNASSITLDDYITRYEDLRDQLMVIFNTIDTNASYIPFDDKSIYLLWAWHKNIALINEFIAVIDKIKNSSDLDSETEYNKKTHTYTYEEAEDSVTEGANNRLFFNNVESLCHGTHNTYKEQAGLYQRTAATILSDYHTFSAQMIVDIIKATDALTAIKTASAELKAKGVVWAGKNANLPAGETQDSMNSELEGKSNAIDDAQIDALITVLNGNLDYFKSVQAAIKGVTYHGIQVLPETIGEPESFYNTYKDLVTASLTIPQNMLNQLNNGIVTNASYCSYLFNAGNTEIAANYANKSTADLSPAQYTKLDTTDPQQKFFQFLITTCSQSAAVSDTESQVAKDSKSTLIAKGNTENTTSVSSGTIPAIANTGDGATYDNGQVSGDDSAVADANTKNMASVATKMGDLGSILEGAAETTRDNLYLMEYITTMFSYNTVDKGANPATTLSGVPISAQNNEFYRAEVEYILWGNAKASDNVLATQALIYGLRLVLNSIYAFTDSEIRAYTLTAATAIAGWTGFGVPIVQTVLIFAIAAAESAIDLINLNDGKDVPIYKTKTTWVLKPSQIFQAGGKALTDAAVTKMKEETQAAANKFFEKVGQLAEEEITSIQGSLTDFVNQTEQSVIDSAVDTVMIPIEEAARSIVSSAENTTQDCEGFVTDQVDVMLLKINGQIDASDTSPQGLAKAAVIQYLQSPTIRSKLIKSITECKQKFNEAVESKATDATELIRTNLMLLFNEIIGGASDKAIGAINKVSDDFKNEVNGQLNALNDKSQTAIEDAANKYIGKMSNSGATSSGTTSNANPKATDSTGNGGLSMSYEDYLKVFILLGTLSGSNRDTMLCRVGNLIQCNMNYEAGGSTNFKGGTDPRFQKGSFALADAYTVIGINATVRVRTTFYGGFNTVSSYDSSGALKSDIDYSNIIGAYWNEFKYSGVTSY